MHTSETKLVVRYVETDQMGIVHHSNYFAWFEMGRTGYIKDKGIRYSDMEEMGVLLPLIESGCRYVSGAKYEDELVVQTQMTDLSPVRAEFNYRVIRENDNKLLAEGFTKHAFVNSNLKPVNIRKNYPKLWEILNRAFD